MSLLRYPEYKDSGVEWLGEVPEHWEIKPPQPLAETDAVWLLQEQLGQLFGRDRTVIGRHLRKVFAEGEHDPRQYVQILHIPNSVSTVGTPLELAR